MTKKSKKAKSKGSSRGRPGYGAGSSETAVVAGRGRNVPRPGLGGDTLLGVAQSQRRTIVNLFSSTLSTGAAGAYAEATLPMNDVYNGGTSAAGFAKYMAFYSKAFVMGARATLKAVVIDNATTSGLVIGVTLTTNSTSLGGYTKAIENGLCRWEVVFNLPDRIHFSEAVDVGKFLHKPQVLDDPQLYCTAAAGPAQVIVAHYWVQTVGVASAPVATNMVAEIEYDVVFTDPIPFT